MVKHKPKRWKGCCYICKNHKDKRQPLRDQVPFTVIRQMGKLRRIKRNYVPDDSQ